MKHSQIKQLVLLFCLLLPTAWCGANSTILNDGQSHITIKIPIVNQDVGTTYSVRWYNSETGQPYIVDSGPGATILLILVTVCQDPDGAKYISFQFPSFIRDLNSGTINNTFGDAIFEISICSHEIIKQ